MAADRATRYTEARLKLGHVFGYLTIVPNEAGILSVTTRRAVATDIAQRLRQSGIEVPERKTFHRLQS